MRRRRAKLMLAGVLALTLDLVGASLAQTASSGSSGTEATVSEKTIKVDHIAIRSRHSVDEARSRLEQLVPKLDPSVLESLVKGDVQQVEQEEKNGPKLSLFLVRDHGALLHIVGRARKAYQFEIGNAITASRMTRYQLSAALYAPLRVVLYEDDLGGAIFEYDKPSDLFGQFGDERVTEVARGLDEALLDALRRAAD
jgi:uncharacterized protein (DUF302 family)